MTRHEWIRWAVEQLNKRNNPTSRLDAEVLLAHVLGLERLKLHMYPDQPVDEVKAKAYESLVLRRSLGEPVAYLTETQEFMGMDFKVSPAVLIPRPDTELLVESVLAFLQEKHQREDARGMSVLKEFTAPALPQKKACMAEKVWRVADIGTGSGCIAVSLAALLPLSTIMAVDLSREALEVAVENIRLHQVGDRVLPRHGNLLDPVKEWVAQEGLLDAIVSNPPYITDGEMEELAVSVAGYEPHSALAGGKDGLDLYRQLTAGAAPLLGTGGLLAFEIGHEQGEDVAALMQQQGFVHIKVLKDLAGFDRVVLGRRP